MRCRQPRTRDERQRSPEDDAPEGPYGNPGARRHLVRRLLARRRLFAPCPARVGQDDPRESGLLSTRRVRRASPLRRSEEHTSELQSHLNLVCRLLLEKKKKDVKIYTSLP